MSERSPIGEKFRLDGQVALVTGAGRGIGRACALALADAGAAISAVSRTEHDLASLVSEIETNGGKAEALIADVTDAAAMRERIEALDRLDVLVNNAGGNVPQPFLEVRDETLDHLLALNVRSVFVVAQAAARVMARGGGGAVVNMSSQMGHVGSPKRTVYCMTKHAIEGLTKAMAVELAPMRIRVNTVAPTFVETPLTRPFFEDERFRSFVMERMPLRRIGSVDDVAAAVVYLASPAAALVTGTSLLVDGGWTAQ